MTKLAVKVDVDTLRGYIEGVPRMLDIFAKHNVKASIYFSFGPDNSGKAIRRIFRKGFISKMLRTKAPSTYGLKTLLYGTLLPAPLIVPKNPGTVRRAFDEGHEVGIHAWDHVYVQDCLAKISKEKYIGLFEQASKLYQEICGCKAKSIAAPGWQLSHTVLSAEQELELDFASDVRGYAPFMPVFEGTEYNVPQIPSTLPTMDEIYGLPGVNDETIPEIWYKGMDKEWNVVTVHAEMEGISKAGVLDRFLTLCKKNNTEFFTLGQYAKTAPLPKCEVLMGNLVGRAGTLAVQKEITD